MPIHHVESLSALAHSSQLPVDCDQLQNLIDQTLGPSGLLPIAGTEKNSLIERLIRYGAEAALHTAVDAINQEFTTLKSDFKACWLVPDAKCAGHRRRPIFEIRRTFQRPSELKNHWLTVICWPSTMESIETMRMDAMEQLFVQSSIALNGPVANLKAWLTLQARAINFSGRSFSTADINLAKKIAQPMRRYYNVNSEAELVPCLYGDNAAQSLGFESLGFPTNSSFVASLVFI